MSGSGSSEPTSSHNGDFYSFSSKVLRTACFYWSEPFSTPHLIVAETVGCPPTSISTTPFLSKRAFIRPSANPSIRLHFPIPL